MKEMCKNICRIILIFVSCILLCGCNKESMDIVEESAEVEELSVEDEYCVTRKFYDWTVDYLSKREVSYIPEHLNEVSDEKVVVSNGMCYYLPGDGTAIIWGQGVETEMSGHRFVDVIRPYKGKELIVPEEVEGCTVVGVGNYAFWTSEVERVVLPDTLCFIAKEAFSECRNLKEIEWGAGIKEIAESAFKYCGLVEVQLPETLEIIGENAFAGTRLEKVVIPNSVKVIKEGAFRYCGELVDVDMGTGVIRIDCEAFSETPWFDALAEEFVIVGDGVLLKYNGSESEIKVEEGVKSLAGAFRDNDLIEKIELPNSLEVVGDLAFLNCDYLKEVILPAEVKYIGSYSIRFSSLYEMRVVIPRGIRYIHNDAFRVSEKLKVEYEGTEEEWKNIIGEHEEWKEIQVEYNVIENP